MKQFVLLTNILTPYRRYFYDLLNEEFRKNSIGFHVLLMAEGEPTLFMGPEKAALRLHHALVDVERHRSEDLVV